MTVQPKKSTVKRTYRAPRRDAQAVATRAAIVAAARELFFARGYPATSIRAVAEAAAVSQQTVYNAFGDKATLLLAVGEDVLAGESTPEWVARIRNEPDPVERIRLVARWSRDGWDHGLLEVESMLFDAAPADERLAAVARTAIDAKLGEYRAMLDILLPVESRRPELDLDEVAQLLVTIDSAAFVQPLLQRFGWTLDQYERWLADVMIRTFLRPDAWRPDGERPGSAET